MPKEVVAAEQVNENNLNKFFAEKPRELHEIEGRKVYGSLWKTAWWFLKKLNTELLYDLAMQLLDIHPEEQTAGTQIDDCMSMVIVALFTVVKGGSQVSIDRRMDKQNVEYYSTLKKEILTHATT